MTTKLEAVNEILQRTGNRAVPALDTGGASMHGRVEASLDRAVARLLQRGWPFNMRFSTTITPIEGGLDAGRIDVTALEAGQTIYRITPVGVDTGRLLTTRGQWLYDLDNNTDIFTASVTVDYVHSVDFADLPYPAARVAIVEAARARLRESWQSNPNAQAADAELQIEFRAAMTELNRWELAAANPNALDTSDVQRVLGGRRYGRVVTGVTPRVVSGGDSGPVDGGGYV